MKSCGDRMEAVRWRLMLGIKHDDTPSLRRLIEIYGRKVEEERYTDSELVEMSRAFLSGVREIRAQPKIVPVRDSIKLSVKFHRWRHSVLGWLWMKICGDDYPDHVESAQAAAREFAEHEAWEKSEEGQRRLSQLTRAA